uniref:BTB domain-containing protein n=1 Tax=Panagrellus redivivus TaxID=6233 RepID=A0A7E4VVD9_PANRE
MSTQQSYTAADITNQICNLFMKEQLFDVVFIIDGEEVLAHQSVLCQRCPVFKAMLKKQSEFEVQTIVLSGTPVDAFKQLLKFIYTGFVELDMVNVGSVFDVLQLARVYGVAKLEQHCVDHLKFICNIDNVVEILNRAVEKSQKALIAHCIEFAKTWAPEFVGHKSFGELSVEALHHLINDALVPLSDDDIRELFQMN